MQQQPQSDLASGPDRRAGSSPSEMQRAQVCSTRNLPFLLEAHDGLSGAIDKHANFKDRWAFGRSIACYLGHAAAPPVSIDADCNFAHFKNAHQPTPKCDQRRAARVALGDRRFPGINSLLDEHHSVAD
ncbi:hypothetical protein [Bradyrhizobium sp. LA2.1]|uniref:hypothetical protein n=1 Tax=Bradyrhizobium sp. LA2.1 TaxID=3156376 RepID=UPI003395A046